MVLRAHVAASFYYELFAIEPGLRKLFTGDMIAQGQKLLDMLALAVASLSDNDTLRPMLTALAMRHAGYGVEERHYDIVRTALMRTLRHELAGEFTPEVAEGWAYAYDTLAATMREAAYGADRAA